MYLYDLALCFGIVVLAWVEDLTLFDQRCLTELVLIESYLVMEEGQKLASDPIVEIILGLALNAVVWLATLKLDV